MLYKGKAIEIIGTKVVFGEQLAWIRILENNSFQQVAYDELISEKTAFSFPYIRFVAIAAKIKDEVAKKNGVNEAKEIRDEMGFMDLEQGNKSENGHCDNYQNVELITDG